MIELALQVLAGLLAGSLLVSAVAVAVGAVAYRRHVRASRCEWSAWWAMEVGERMPPAPRVVDGFGGGSCDA